MRRRIFVAVVCLLVLLAPCPAAAQTRARGITPDDYYSLQFAGDPRLSPEDGSAALKGRRAGADPAISSPGF